VKLYRTSIQNYSKKEKFDLVFVNAPESTEGFPGVVETVRESLKHLRDDGILNVRMFTYEDLPDIFNLFKALSEEEGVNMKLYKNIYYPEGVYTLGETMYCFSKREFASSLGEEVSRAMVEAEMISRAA
jgi:trans-aconitate methyltransferase